MSEKFALHKIPGDGAAIDRYEDPSLAIAFTVNKTGNKLLAGTRFALYKNSCFGSRHSAQKPQDVFHFRTAINNTVGKSLLFNFLPKDDIFRHQLFVRRLEFGGEPFVFPYQLHFFKSLMNHHTKVIGLPGFGNVFVNFAGVDGGDKILNVGKTR